MDLPVRRIIEQTIREELPEDFQTAEFLLQHGQLDAVISRYRVKRKISKYFRNSSTGRCTRVVGELEFEKPIIELRKKIADLKEFTKNADVDLSVEIEKLESRS